MLEVESGSDEGKDGALLQSGLGAHMAMVQPDARIVGDECCRPHDGGNELEAVQVAVVLLQRVPMEMRHVHVHLVALQTQTGWD